MALLERRGYALPPARLGELCLGGSISPLEVRFAVAASGGELREEAGLVVSAGLAPRAVRIRRRAASHAQAAAAYLPETYRFVRRLVALCPYVLSVSIAGSLASGGFRETDDVDLNLVVEDGRRHLAYAAVNLLAYMHALRFRGKPVDHSTRRPLAPRLMTLNLVLERAQCFPLVRQDEDMAFELLQSVPVFGTAFLRELLSANPGLSVAFPQLLELHARVEVLPRCRLPAGLFPAWLDRPARLLGKNAWRYMQWTRRRSPEALARVAFVRQTMRPYTLFEDP
ncbi:MAG TPA: hypothetical protein VF160_09040 [Candidatus Dormibacteraeota bacterium]